MAGHSKWATTKRHKAVVDAKRGKIFSVYSKDLTMAARDGGGDPEFNPRLRTIIQKAKAANMPADNIDRAIKKGTGELPGMVIEEILLEGYAPAGVGFLVEITTDNKNRSVPEVRATFSKHGGNMASPGAVAHNFQRFGQFIISKEQTSEEKLMEVALEAGAEDIKEEDDIFEVLTPVNEYYAVSNALETAGITCESSELAYIPSVTIPLTDAETVQKVLKLMDLLEELDDVKTVHANFDIAPELLPTE